MVAAGRDIQFIVPLLTPASTSCPHIFVLRHHIALTEHFSLETLTKGKNLHISLGNPTNPSEQQEALCPRPVASLHAVL